MARSRTSSEATTPTIAEWRSRVAARLPHQGRDEWLTSWILLVTRSGPRPPANRLDVDGSCPPIWSLLVRTTSMPTPRRKTECYGGVGRKAGVKMNLCIWASVLFSFFASRQAVSTASRLDPLGVEAAGRCRRCS